MNLGHVMAQVGHVAESHAASIARDVVELIDDAVDAGEFLIGSVFVMRDFLRMTSFDDAG